MRILPAHHSWRRIAEDGHRIGRNVDINVENEHSRVAQPQRRQLVEAVAVEALPFYRLVDL